MTKYLGNVIYRVARPPLKNTSVMWVSWINMKIIIIIVMLGQRSPNEIYPLGFVLAYSNLYHGARLH